MALSTLQAQLAALNDGNKNPGSVYTSSRRYDQAVGRGLNFSAQHGHNVRNNFYKPSFMAESARKAADIPLQTLAENCQLALEELGTMYNESDDVFWSDAEMVCETKTTVPYKVVHGLLVRLSALLFDDSATTACFHVLEYLLRRFDLHTRQFEDLLFTLWPSSSKHPATFLRALQFIDLGEHPSYLWLRPYTRTETLPPRQQLSQHAMTRADLLRKMCAWSSEVSNVSGASPVLSYTSAVIVEGLAWTQKQTQENLDLISQTLFPTVLNACSGQTEEWKGWGWIVASVLVESMPLASKAVTKLTEKVLEDRSPASVMVAVSLLCPSHTEPKIGEASSFLTLINGSKLGCSTFPSSVRDSLIQIEQLPAILGELNREIVVSPFVAALLVSCAMGEMDGAIRELLQEPTLSDFWQDVGLDLVASMSCWIVHKRKHISVPCAQSILKSLHSTNAVACERGIGKFIEKWNETESATTRNELLKLLGGVLVFDDPSEKGMNSDSVVLLPARIAIEDADEDIRIGAIDRLRKDAKQDGLAETLVRRWAGDKGENFALAVCKAIVEVLETPEIVLDSNHLVRWTLEATCFWALQYDSRTSLAEVMVAVLAAAGSVARTTASEMASGTSWKSLIQLLLALADCQDEKLALAARKAVLQAFGKNVEDKSKTLQKAFDNLVLSEMEQLKLLDKRFSAEWARIDERLQVRKHYFHVCLKSMSAALQQQSLTIKPELVFSICLEALNAAGGSAASEKSLLKVLDWSFTELDFAAYQSLDALSFLAACGSEDDFKIIVHAALKKFLARFAGGDGKPPAVALVLEAAASPRSDRKVKCRLLSLANELVADQASDSLCGVVPAMFLLESPENDVRTNARELLKSLSKKVGGRKARKGWERIPEMCHILLEMTQGPEWKGGSVIARAISSLTEKSPSREAVECVIRLCLYSYLSVTDSSCTDATKAVESTWLRFGQASGGVGAASYVLSAVASLGESLCPLALMWKIVGQHLLGALLAEGQDASPTCRKVVVQICELLTGATRPVSKLFIVAGPSNGRRARSYSFGKDETNPYISPYPDEMIKSIQAVLNSHARSKAAATLAHELVDKVLSDDGWKTHICGRLPLTDKIDIVSCVLKYLEGTSIVISDDFFPSLPLSCLDLDALLKKEGTSVNDVILLADHVRSNAAKLHEEADLSKVVGTLLSILEKSSSSWTTEFEFAALSILLALKETLSGKPAISIGDRSLQSLKNTMQVLLSSNSTALVSGRTKTAAVQFLASLAETDPKVGVPLLFAIISSALKDPSAYESGASWMQLVPIFTKFSEAANHPITPLLVETVRSGQGNEEKPRVRLYKEFAIALSKSSIPDYEKILVCNTALGAFVAVLLSEADNHGVLTVMSTDATDIGSELLSKAPGINQLSSVILLLVYAKDACVALQGKESPSDVATLLGEGHKSVPSVSDLVQASGKSGSKKARQNKLLVLMASLVKTANDILSLDAFSKFLRKTCKGKSSLLPLQLWQDMLALESSFRAIDRVEDNEHYASLSSLLDRSRDVLQDILPVPLFLASASSIITGDGSDALRASVLRLVGQGSLRVDPVAAEFSLFLDLLPDLVAFSNPHLEVSFVLREGSLVAIDNITRSLRKDKLNPTLVKLFLNLIGNLSELVKAELQSSGGQQHQLSSSVSLCGGSLVRLMGPKCLPVLPKFVALLGRVLCKKTSLLRENDAKKSPVFKEAEFTALGVLRCLVSVTESVPQFLPSCLGFMLKEDCALSDALYHRDANELSASRERLEIVMSEKIPCRLFIPSVAKAMKPCSSKLGKISLLSMLNQSLDRATNSECSVQRERVLAVVKDAFDFDGDFEDRKEMVDLGCQVLIALVMKLSEIDLRKLFSSLREWCSIESGDANKVASKKYAFWSACCVLSKSVKSIFLPCLALAFSDAVRELNLAVSAFCGSSKVEKRGGKRRRVSKGDEDQELNVESMRVLQPLLLCLELSLTSDAQEGGEWIRSDDNERYQTLLEPLGKLLQAKVPPNFPSSEAGFQILVLGPGLDRGSVMGCLIALASAGGNEQLWKPLNHAVLEACGNESRAEVRRAGLVTLLALIKSLGEEYLVLIPGCLPVLAELLEDTDEDVSSLARDVVTQAEELLGESLESSLR